jgi:peptidoglycan/LPS O-acetylase OafA/YrhL
MLHYVNNLRGFVILAIVLLHSLFFMPRGSFYSELLLVFLRNYTYFFVFISGFFLSYLIKRYSYKPYLISKLKNVFSPYILISLPAIIIYVLGYKNNHLWLDMDWFHDLNVVGEIAYLYLTGAHLGPLWFIPVICVFFLFFPIFEFLHNNPSLLYTVLIVALAAAVVVGRPVNNDNVLFSFVYFLPAYLLGIVVELTRIYEKGSKWFSICVIFLAYSITLLYSVRLGFDYRFDGIIKPIWSIALISFFYHFVNFESKILGFYGRISFYVFFAHGYVIGFLRQFSVDVLFDFWFLVYPVVILFTTLGYFLAKLTFKKYSRYVIGSD